MSSREPPPDELPTLEKLPKPSGWFEVFCCMAILLAFGAVLLFLGLYH